MQKKILERISTKTVIDKKTSLDFERSRSLSKESKDLSDNSANNQEKLINNTNMTIEEMYQLNPLNAVDDSRIPPSVLYMLKKEPNEYISLSNEQKLSEYH